MCSNADPTTALVFASINPSTLSIQYRHLTNAMFVDVEKAALFKFAFYHHHTIFVFLANKIL